MNIVEQVHIFGLFNVHSIGPNIRLTGLIAVCIYRYVITLDVRTDGHLLWIFKRKNKRIKSEMQLESNSQPLGWKSDVLTTVPPV